MKTIGHNSIVVGIDGSPAGAAALDWAVEEATRRRLPLHLVRGREREIPSNLVLGTAPAAALGTAQQTEIHTTEMLTSAAARARSASPTLSVMVESSKDLAAAVLVELSTRADTVVLGSHGDGVVLTAILGSVSTQVALHAECPVVILREAPAHGGGVVVGVDGSEVSDQALGYAFDEASSRGLPLDVVHARWTSTAGGSTADLLEDQTKQELLTVSESTVGWSEKFPDVTVRHHLRDGPAVRALVEKSRGAELLVVGSRGRGGFARLLLGSVSHGVLHHAHCPVAVVRTRSEQPSYS